MKPTICLSLSLILIVSFYFCLVYEGLWCTRITGVGDTTPCGAKQYGDYFLMVCIKKFEILKYTQKSREERGANQYLTERYRLNNKSFMK